MRQVAELKWLWLILAVAFLLRLVGLRFGLPDLYHADEPIVVNHAMAYGSGDLNPHFFQIPPLVSYVLFGLIGFYFLVGALLGYFSNMLAFADLFFSNPSSFYALGRFVLGTMAGTATVCAVYILGTRVASARIGLWAAAMLGVCFLHVRDSHYIYTDIPLTLALVVAVLTSVRLYENGTMQNYLWAGALVGLCTAIKYNAALVAGAYCAAHLLRGGRLRDQLFSVRVWAGAGACLVVFLILNPFAVLDFSFFCQSFSAQSKAQRFVGWMHVLSYSLFSGMGVMPLVAAFAGMGLAAYQKNKRACILLGFLIPFYLGITLFGQEHDRYALPLIPFLAVFLGIFADAVVTRYQGLPRMLSLAFFLGLFLVPTLAKSVYSDWLFLQPDSRTLAKQWIEANVQAGSKIALDHTFYGPRLLPSGEQLKEKLSRETSAQKQKKLGRLLTQVQPQDKRYNLYFLSDEAGTSPGFLFDEPRIPFDFQKLREEGIRVVVSHSRLPNASHAEFYEQLRSHAVVSRSFSPYRQEGQEFSLEPYVRTGGASLWREMLSRKSNGEFVQITLLE